MTEPIPSRFDAALETTQGAGPDDPPTACAMTVQAMDPLRALAALLGRIEQILRTEDAASARADAAAVVDQLRELVARSDRARPASSAALFDFARIGDALRVLAECLRAPGLAGDASTAIAALQAALGPLALRAPARDVVAIREHHRQRARAAMSDYFRRNPHKPFKP